MGPCSLGGECQVCRKASKYMEKTCILYLGRDESEGCIQSPRWMSKVPVSKQSSLSAKQILGRVGNVKKECLPWLAEQFQVSCCEGFKSTSSCHSQGCRDRPRERVSQCSFVFQSSFIRSLYHSSLSWSGSSSIARL